jgi:hypothetical protein
LQLLAVSFEQSEISLYHHKFLMNLRVLAESYYSSFIIYNSSLKMKPLFLCFSENLDYALGWMVVHSLWQATLIAFIAGALNIALRKRSARVRYIVSNVSCFPRLGVPARK